MSAAPPTELEIGDHKFQVSRLKVKDSLRGLKLVGKILMPAFAEASAAPAGQLGSALVKVVESLDCLPELLDLFAASSKVQTTSGSFMSLTPVLDDTFIGHPDHAVQFVVECVQKEYGTFLGENGQIKALVAKLTPKIG